MKNLIIQPNIRRKIDIRVEKILSDLDHPEPPLRLEDVRALLRLHLGYYQSDSEGLMQRMVHKLIMGGKQLIANPALLKEVVKKRNIKALLLPDHSRIMIDENLHKSKHRWAEGHETIHKILEWHEPAMRGDNELTMKQACQDKVEAEANYGAGQLLFLRERFTAEVMDSPPTVELVKNLAATFKNTHASTLWRLVETAGRNRPMLGVMHYNPHPRFASSKNDPINPCRHFIRSDAFVSQFSATAELKIFELISSYIQDRKGGPLGSEMLLLADDNGAQHEFVFETFGFFHECLTLGIHVKKHAMLIGV